jgi:hypothetical protein
MSLNTNDKIKLGTSILKAVVAGLGKSRGTRPTETTKQNSNVSGCGGCSRSAQK